MNIVGLGKTSGLGYTGEETNLLGLHRSSQFDSFNEQHFNSHAITPFQGDGMQGGLGSSGPISLIGNTRRMGHRDDLSMEEGGAHSLAEVNAAQSSAKGATSAPNPHRGRELGAKHRAPPGREVWAN